MKYFISLCASLTSAVLLAFCMPPFFDLPFVGFFALVPLLVALKLHDKCCIFKIILPFAFLYVGLVYRWYLDIFSLYVGIALMMAVGFYHARLVGYGLRFERKIGGNFGIFMLPLVYSSFEFMQRQIPFVNEWWFVPYAKSQWGFIEALGLLSITGISGVSFILLLSNSALSEIIANKISKQKQNISSFFALFIVMIALVFGYFNAKIEQNKIIKVAAISDMANSINGQNSEGYFVKDKNISKKILFENLKLSKQIIAQKPNFIVWSENEFINSYDEKSLKILKDFSKQTQAYLIVDSFLNQNNKLYDTALIISPDENINYAKKTHLFKGEISAGFSSSDEKPKAFMSDFGKIGAGVCFDFHFDDIVRKLVKDGAKVLFFPTDDDMNKNKFFPYFHQSDAVFRAIEYNIPIVSANTNGASVIVNCNGKINNMSAINQQSAIVSSISLKHKTTIYEKYGEWFGYLLVLLLIFMILKARKVDKLS